MFDKNWSTKNYVEFFGKCEIMGRIFDWRNFSNWILSFLLQIRGHLWSKVRPKEFLINSLPEPMLLARFKTCSEHFRKFKTTLKSFRGTWISKISKRVSLKTNWENEWHFKVFISLIGRWKRIFLFKSSINIKFAFESASTAIFN